MKPDEIKQVLADHALWLVDPTKGKQANLYRANLSWADLYEANLRGADIYEANLCGANLSEADLSGANLHEANLSGANLSGANLCGANLYEANLSGADLRGADLRGADLYEANLCGANLCGANLSEADLSGANLQEVRGLIFADCCWTGHGEKGRRLIGIKTEKGEITLYCGCFIGSKEELAWYISDGDEIHRESRTKAMEFVLSCLQ